MRIASPLRYELQNDETSRRAMLEAFETSGKPRNRTRSYVCELTDEMSLGSFGQTLHDHQNLIPYKLGLIESPFPPPPPPPPSPPPPPQSRDCLLVCLRVCVFKFDSSLFVYLNLVSFQLLCLGLGVFPSLYAAIWSSAPAVVWFGKGGGCPVYI